MSDSYTVLHDGGGYQVVRRDPYYERCADDHGEFRVRRRSSVCLREAATGRYFLLYDGGGHVADLRAALACRPDGALLLWLLGMATEPPPPAPAEPADGSLWAWLLSPEGSWKSPGEVSR